jgi:transposase
VARKIHVAFANELDELQGFDSRVAGYARIHGEGHGPVQEEGDAHPLKGARYALWKNPDDLTERQQAKLADIARTNKRLYRAYLLKEQLRMVFHQDTAEDAIALLDAWLAWASRSQIPAFVKLARTIRTHKTRIHAALTHGLSNARVESMNQKLRLIMRRAFGFRSIDALIGLAMLAHGGLCPPLPGRTATA